MAVDASSLNEIVRKLGDAVECDCTLVAAGGTALTLHGLKPSTEDVDFVVEYGDKDAVGSAAASIGGPRMTCFRPVLYLTTRFRLITCRGWNTREGSAT